jgi:hypothetical protein
MQLQKRPLSKHHRARLIAWTLAMLAWLAQVLVANVLFTPRHERQRGARMSLERLERQVKLLILSRALDMLPCRRRCGRAFRGRSLTPHNFIRAAIGVRMKRKLQGHDIVSRIVALMHALTHIDEYAKLIAKRLRRGLTRRWLALFAIGWPRGTPVLSAPASAPLAADSS